MKILFLGDVVGKSGCESIIKNLPKQIKTHKIDFVITNGENAADQGVGITEKITKKLFSSGVDAITTGNHVWDQIETLEHIKRENKLLRPINLLKSPPGKGYEVFISKNNFKIGVLNLMGNVFMKKTEDVFKVAQTISKKLILKKNVDFLVVDFHGEITSEKMAIGHFFDGLSTCVVGTHTHVPTADTRILEKGTAYQTDIGMCGDYNSVIGMNKENSIKRFFKDKGAIAHFPADGEGTLSGIIVETDFETGLAKKITRLINGGSLAR